MSGLAPVELPDDIDPECRELCAAMNRVPGIFTTESCCGHGGRPYRVWFSADSLESLPPVLYYFDRCHSGLSGWSVAAETDCAMNPVRFVVTGPVGGYIAPYGGYQAMKRRTVFGMLLGGMASLVPGFRVRASEAKPFDPTVPDGYATNGSALCRIYRQDGEGVWRLISQDQIRPGDCILCVGQNQDRLWKCEAIVVRDRVPSHKGDGGGVSYHDRVDLLDRPVAGG